MLNFPEIGPIGGPFLCSRIRSGAPWHWSRVNARHRPTPDSDLALRPLNLRNFLTTSTLFSSSMLGCNTRVKSFTGSSVRLQVMSDLHLEVGNQYQSFQVPIQAPFL